MPGDDAAQGHEYVFLLVEALAYGVEVFIQILCPEQGLIPECVGDLKRIGEKQGLAVRALKDAFGYSENKHQQPENR